MKDPRGFINLERRERERERRFTYISTTTTQPYSSVRMNSQTVLTIKFLCRRNYVEQLRSRTRISGQRQILPGETRPRRIKQSFPINLFFFSPRFAEAVEMPQLGKLSSARISLTNSSHTSSFAPVSQGAALLPCATYNPTVSHTKAVALDGAESDPLLFVLCYRVATFGGGENTGDDVMGPTFYCLPTLFAAIPRGDKLSAGISKTNLRD